MRAALALGLAFALTACAATPIRYAGTLTRTSGTCTSSPATLAVRGTAISFAPADGVLILPGTVSDGHVTASLATQGANGHPFPMDLTGTLTPTQFTGRFRTPECRADVVLLVK